MAYDPQARAAYKAQARADIRVKFWPTIGAVILQLLPMFLISMIMSIGMEQIPQDTAPTMEELRILGKYLAIFGLATFLIGSPITFGAKHYFVSRARGEESSPTQVLICFTGAKKFITSLKLALCIGIRSLGWLVLIYAVMVVTMLPLFLFDGVDALIVMYLLMWVVVVIALALWVSVKIRRYDGAYICMIDTPDAGVWKAVGACTTIFKGHQKELLMFDLSFILWQIAAGLTAIVSLYVVPYTEIAFVHYFDDLCGRAAAESQL